MIARRTKVQLAIFALITMLGVSFVGARYAQLNRLFYNTSYTVVAHFHDSGGMYAGGLVSYRGVRVGEVDKLVLTHDGVDAYLDIDRGWDGKIPADTLAVVGNRSAVGEQYVDLQPQTDNGPYLHNGSQIAMDDTRTPLPTQKLLSDISTTVESVNRKSLRTTVHELGKAFGGTGPDLQRIIDTGTSFIGGVFTDRENRGGGGHNRVFGPDFSYRPNPSDAFKGELLLSNTDDPVNGERASSYAFVSSWRRQKERYDGGADLNQLGHHFRADLGFLPQVGYREADAAFGYHWYPQHSMFSYIRASVFVDEQQDVVTHQTVFRRTSPGIGFQGVKNLFVGPVVHLAEQYRVNGKLLTATFAEFQAQIDPSRRFTRIALSGVAGERVDFANARVGHGATLTLTSTVRPIDKLSFDAHLSREWLDVAGGRLYTASVERLKTTYSFSAKSLVRVIGQYVKTDFASGPDQRQFNGSILYSYKVNWQTVLYVGYGDDRALTPANDLAPLDRSLFFKISYAIQR